ncbi:MAG: ATP-grasp domain-containing protein [Methanolinea sp.]|nr:ATP-grasp domain-containing protein [Methanolinea sp.]
MTGSVLVAGFSTRHVAKSAHAAGYTVYAVDHFCDQDLSWYTHDMIRFEDLDDLPAAVSEMCGRHRIDWAIPTSGAEALLRDLPVLGTPPGVAARFLDKLATQEFFESLGVPVPRLRGDNQYPAMVKPRWGSGGWRNRVVSSARELASWREEFGAIEAIVQEVVEGIPASVSCLADGRGHARAVAANMQILRGAGDSAYGFCGSLTPLDHPLAQRMAACAERIAASSGCRGCIGIDFVLGERDFFAIEVNPRFQATLDTVEMSLGINLFSAHVQACHGTLPSPDTLHPARVAVRRILFAERDCTVEGDLSPLFPAVSDIPWPGASFEEGQAIVSVYGWGETAEEAWGLLDTHIRRVRQYVR